MGILSTAWEINWENPEQELWGVQPALWREVIPYFANDCDLEMTAEGARAIREYLVPWHLRQPFAAQLLGYPYLASDGSMRRHLPESIEVLVGDDAYGFMFANRLRFKPLGGGGEMLGASVDSNGNVTFSGADVDYSNFALHRSTNHGQLYRSWDYALFQVEYTTPLHDIFDRDQIIEAYGPAGNYLNGNYGSISGITSHEMHRYVVWNDEGKTQIGVVEHGNWVYGQYENGVLVGPSNVPVGNKVGVPIPSGELILTWLDVHPQGYSLLNFRRQQGKYNNHEFLDYPLGTLVFDSWKRKRRRSPFGDRTVNIEFKFIWKPYGVNAVVGPDGGVRVILQRGTPDVGPVRPGNFFALFHHEYIEA